MMVMPDHAPAKRSRCSSDGTYLNHGLRQLLGGADGWQIALVIQNPADGAAVHATEPSYLD